MSKPDPSEYSPYFKRYIDFVTEPDDIVGALERQGEATASLLAGVAEDRADFRYAPGKWTIRDLVNHVADAERIFNYRALSIARGDTRSLPGFDENEFAAHADANRRALKDIVAELEAVRRSTVAMYRGFADAAWKRIGTANDNRISVNALAYVTLGHERHHMKILRERYGVEGRL